MDPPPQSVGEYINPHHIDVEKWGVFSAGRVSSLTHVWRKYSTDWELLKSIHGYKLEFIYKPAQKYTCKEIQVNATENKFLEKEIATLLEKKVIQQVGHEEGEFVSNIFLREKKQPGKYRMILNLSDLNEFIVNKHF